MAISGAAPESEPAADHVGSARRAEPWSAPRNPRDHGASQAAERRFVAAEMAVVSPDEPRSMCCRRSKSHDGPMEIVGIGALDLDGGEFPDPQWPPRCHVHGPVDLRGIALAAAPGTMRADHVDENLLAGADMSPEAARRDRLLVLHETVPALLFDLVRHRRAEIVGGGAIDRLVAEAADPVERGFAEPIEQQREVGLGLAGKTDDEGRAQGDVRADRAPSADALQRPFLSGGAAHPPQHLRCPMLERHIEIRQHLSLGH